MHCQNCGHELVDGVSFCSNCGAPVTPAEEPVNEGRQSYQEQAEQQCTPDYEEQQHSAQAEPPNDSKAIVSLVCGIIAAITMFTGGGAIIGIIAAIVGLVFGVKARKENPSTMATVGIILCSITLVLCALVFIACVACISTGVATGAGTELLESITT